MKRDKDCSKKPTESKLCCFGYVDYIVLASTLAIALGEELSNQDIEILSTFFAVLSDELALISTVNGCSSSDTEETFVSPVPDVAITSNRHGQKNTDENSSKKIIRKKIKKYKRY